MKIRITRKRKHFLKGLLIALAIGLAGSLVSYFQLFHTLGLRSGDLLYRGQDAGSSADAADKIVIVAIDEASLAELGRFSSWPRSTHTRLVNTLSQNGARVIAFDILFSEPSPDDAALAAAMEKAGNVVLPFALDTDSGQGEIIRPLKIFEASAQAAGHAQMAPDDDGVARRLPLLIPRDSRYEASLALAAVAKYLRRPQVFDSSPQENHLTLAGREIPLQAYGMLINYTSKEIETVSYADVLRGAFASDVFRDKIVLIGMTALGFGDTYWTPLGQARSGVEIHAQAMSTILSGRFIKPISPIITYIGIMLLALICGLVTLRWRVARAALSSLALSLLYFLAVFYFFSQGWLLDMFYTPLSLATVYLGVNLYNVASERMEKGEITRTFGKFVSPAVAAKILDTVNEGPLELGGKEHPVTVLFADVRNFTGFCENNSPEVTVSTLNRYLSVIIEAISQNDGMVNKFGGDSVMAVWNAPIGCPEHALHATRAAVQAQQKIRELQSNLPHLPKMEFGIGVNSGQALVGNMGSLERLEYSVIGDTVNTTARLAAVAPGGKVWIGAETFESVKDYFETAPLEPLALKGKGIPVRAYEVSSLKH